MTGRSAPRSIRVVPELRPAHLEHHRRATPASMRYFATKYDLAGTVIPADVRRTTVPGLLRSFLTTPATVLEVPEPLWLRVWPKHAAIALGFRLAGVLRRRRHRVVTWAMENNDLATLVGGGRRVPRVLVGAVGLLVGAVTRLGVDRICFASDAARRSYRRLPFTAGIDQTLRLELPGARAGADAAEPASCVFVGTLETRKGVQELLSAWTLVEQRLPSARLTVVGDGPLRGLVDDWAALDPTRRRALGALTHAEVPRVLEASAVLAAPSLPEGRWIEQIGLPIKEALAVGLTVVTTRQSGLSDWLEAHGHHVVDPTLVGLRSRLADALVAALAAPIPRGTVTADLPAEDGWLAADAWLHRDA